MAINYKKLPSPLSKGAELFDTQIERDIFVLSAITAISSCFPNYTGEYDRETLNANLYCFIAAPPASGKSAMKYGVELVSEIHSFKKNVLQKPQSSKSPPPVARVLIVPGDTTSAALISLLNQNRDGLLLAETEADTVGMMLGKEYGNYSDLLRKASHHERCGRTRKTDNEHIEVEFPRLSMLLTGTPGQISGLISNTSDGMFTRVLFYYVDKPIAWRGVRSNKSTNKNAAIQPMAAEIFKYWKAVKKKRSMTFVLTESQWDQIEENGILWTEETRVYGQDATGIAFRHSVMFFRIAMVIGILRYFEKGLKDDNVYIDDEDFEQAYELISSSFNTSLKVFAKLNKINVSNVLGTRVQQYYDSLADEFDYSQETKLVAEKLKIPDRTRDHYLQKLKTEKLIIPSKNKKGFWIKP